MPNRILREAILDSEAVNKLTAPEEVFYRRLMSAVDDFGRFDGRASVLKSRLYPLRADKVRESDISLWIAACVKAGLIALYHVDGKPYVLFPKLGKPRASVSKFPSPPDDLLLRADANICLQTRAYESKRNQTIADVPYSNSDSDSDSISCPEPAKPASEQPVLTFPTVGEGAKEWHLVASQIAKWKPAYPGIDILGECRKALAWVEASPQRRKTAKGMTKFLNGWLSRAQNRGGMFSQTPQPPPAKVDCPTGELQDWQTKTYGPPPKGGTQ